MKTYANQLESLKQNEFDYYYSVDSNRKLNNPFINSEDHTKFIDRYFKRAGKSILIYNFPIKSDVLKRPAHVSSTFFLGLLIFYRSCKNNKFVNAIKTDNSLYKELPFIWFLATLFHDMAEKMEEELEAVKKYAKFQMLIEKEEVEYNLLDDFKGSGIPKSLFDLIPSYFEFRISDGKCDHGIFAGIYFYDQLVKNRKSRLAKIQQAGSESLFWGPSLDQAYGLTAASIAIHNIWVKSVKPDYQKWISASLINFKPLSITDYPIPFIFGIVDTIDPIKYFCYKEVEGEKNLTFENVLNGIGFEFRLNVIKIKNIKIPNSYFEKYSKYLSDGFDKWLQCNVAISRSKIISLIFD